MERHLSDESAVRRCTRGVLVGFDHDGEALVDFPDNPYGAPVAAISILALTEKDLNREAILLFEDGAETIPILVGLRQKRADVKAQAAPPPLALEYEGKRLVISAEQEVVLRCGKASILLKKDGSVRIRGTEIVSRATATNRVRGGNVQIN